MMLFFIVRVHHLVVDACGLFRSQLASLAFTFVAAFTAFGSAFSFFSALPCALVAVPMPALLALELERPALETKAGMNDQRFPRLSQPWPHAHPHHQSPAAKRGAKCCQNGKLLSIRMDLSPETPVDQQQRLLSYLGPLNKHIVKNTNI